MNDDNSLELHKLEPPGFSGERKSDIKVELW